MGSHEREREMLAEMASHRSLVLFVGAGVSLDAGLPTWNQLVRPLSAELGVAGPVDPLDVTQWHVDAKGRAATLAIIKRQLARVQRPGKMHRALAALPAPVIFTTNYDQLMELALEAAQGVPPDVIIEDGHVALIDEGRRTTLVKLHGCLSLPETIVLARDDYEGYAEGHRAMVAYFQSLLATRTFLFVGFSLLDPNFRVIHHAIRRALGAYRREAYLLDAVKKPSYSVDYWRQRGVRTLTFPSFEAVRQFIEEVAADTATAQGALSAARMLARPEPPSIVVAGLVERLRSLRTTLQEVIEQARGNGLLPEGDGRAVEAPPSPPDAGDLAAHRVRAKARALLDLAFSVDHIVPVEDQGMWISLGDMLYMQGDSSSAIRAYHAALRPVSASQRLDQATMMRVRGNLARALSYEGHHARAEWLLRRCVFLPGQELADQNVDPESVLARLNLDHLRERATDASEFGYAVSVRALRLMTAGHDLDAFEALREARYVLGPLLGLTNDADRRLGLRPDEVWDGALDRCRTNSRLAGRRRRPFNPRAYAFNCMGKCYRLSCALALDLGRDSAPQYLDQAEVMLKHASTLDPYLPYPYAHRLMLQTDQRLPPQDRARLLEDVRAELARLPATRETQRLIASLQERFPALALP